MVSLQSWITSSNVAAPFLVTSSGCRAVSQSIKLYAVTLTCLAAGFQADRGSVVPVAALDADWTKPSRQPTPLQADVWRDQSPVSPSDRQLSASNAQLLYTHSAAWITSPVDSGNSQLELVLFERILIA